MKPSTESCCEQHFHEFGLYDLPAKIDHILRHTGFAQVIYVGHSMATSTFLVMSSSRPEYNSKILASFLLAPVALTVTTDQLKPIYRTLLFPNAKLIYKTLSKLRLYELFPRSVKLYRLLEVSCGPGPFQSICLEVIGDSYGEHRENINLKKFGKLMVSLVTGTTIKNTYHLTQLYESGKFRQFDFGLMENIRRYGKSAPPDYPLDNATAPIYIYYGQNDALMTPKVVYRLARALPNIVAVKAVKDPKFTHLDFLFGNNAKEVLYDDLVKEMKSLQRFSSKADQLGYSWLK